MPLKKEEIKDIRAIYRKERNVIATINRFEEIRGYKPAKRTVYRILHESGDFESQGHGGHRHGLSEDQLRRLHKKYKGDVQLMAKESYQTVKNIIARCRLLGLEPKNCPRYYKGKSKSFENPNDASRKYESALEVSSRFLEIR